MYSPLHRIQTHVLEIMSSYIWHPRVLWSCQQKPLQTHLSLKGANRADPHCQNAPCSSLRGSTGHQVTETPNCRHTYTQVSGTRTPSLRHTYAKSQAHVRQVTGTHTPSHWHTYAKSQEHIRQVTGTHTPSRKHTYAKSQEHIRQVASTHTPTHRHTYNMYSMIHKVTQYRVYVRLGETYQLVCI